MVVEDEPLVGLMMVDIVKELGFSVCGPFINVAEATAAARGGNCEDAVLDINLKGELVYPVADMLAESGVPFIFVTGYSSDLVEKRFAEVPVVQKPVNVIDLQRMCTSLTRIGLQSCLADGRPCDCPRSHAVGLVVRTGAAIAVAAVLGFVPFSHSSYSGRAASERG